MGQIAQERQIPLDRLPTHSLMSALIPNLINHNACKD
jgi:hypothetical protein